MDEGSTSTYKNTQAMADLKRSFPANTGGIVMIFYSGIHYDTLEVEEDCRKIERGTDGRQNLVDTGFSGRKAEYKEKMLPTRPISRRISERHSHLL